MKNQFRENDFVKNWFREKPVSWKTDFVKNRFREKQVSHDGCYTSPLLQVEAQPNGWLRINDGDQTGSHIIVTSVSEVYIILYNSLTRPESYWPAEPPWHSQTMHPMTRRPRRVTTMDLRTGQFHSKWLTFGRLRIVIIWWSVVPATLIFSVWAGFRATLLTWWNWIGRFHTSSYASFSILAPFLST